MDHVKTFLEAELQRERAALDGIPDNGPAAEARRQPLLNRVAVLDWLLRRHDAAPMGPEDLEVTLEAMAAGNLERLGVVGIRGDFLGLSRDEAEELLARWRQGRLS